ADRVDGDAELSNELLLAGIERAHPDQRDALRVERREPKAVPSEAVAQPERGRQRHPMDVSRGRRVGRGQVAMCVQPQDAPSSRSREPTQRPHRDRVVAAEHQRHQAFPAGSLDFSRDPRACLEDLVQESSALDARLTRLGERRLDVAAVLDLDARALEPFAQARVPDRRGPHVDAAAARAEIERRSDDRDAGGRHRHSLRACRELRRYVWIDVVRTTTGFLSPRALLLGLLRLLLRERGTLAGLRRLLVGLTPKLTGLLPLVLELLLPRATAADDDDPGDDQHGDDDQDDHPHGSSSLSDGRYARPADRSNGPLSGGPTRAEEGHLWRH